MHSGHQNGSSNHQDNPFADRVDDHTYHSEAIREKRLNLILHLASYSAVLLIQGEKGSGKSTFLDRLRERAQPNWVVCRINGGPGFDKSMLYHALFRVFTSGIPLEGENHPDESLALLMRELAALRHEHRIPVLIIDDADHLPDGALETLEELLIMDGGNEDLLSIILSTEPGFEARLVESSLQTFKNRISHVFDLPAFSEQDTSEYIHLRLSAAGIEEGNPFTPSALHLIHTSSHGIPGRINSLAQQILAKEKRPQPRQDAPRETKPSPVKVEARIVKAVPKRSRGWGKIALGIVLIPLLGLLFFQDTINRWLERTPTPKSTSSSAPMPARPIELAATPPPQQAPEHRPAPLSREPQDIARPEAPAAPPVEPSDAAANVHPQPKKEVKIEQPVSVTKTPTAAPATLAPSPEPAPSPITHTPDPAASLVKEPKVAASGSETKIKPAEINAAVETPAAVNTDEQWLMSRPEGHYTLQLLVMSPEGAKRFIARQALGDALHTFARIHNGKLLVVLVYGDYASKAEARAAAKGLRTRIKTLKPWIRPVSSIKNDIRS